ncbi:MAG: OmpA family protein [Duncaniella sp.]|nr:OmpA family protein [Duncaniella sp.]HBI59208.1 OmpA family protein [Porphyromonadaceae bacterium]
MNKVRVYGKAQNRTALGIAHAYTVMYPHATLADLRKAFPNSICPDSGVKELFLPLAEAETFNTKMSLYFAKPDEVLTLGDGSQVALAQVWSKPSFERMVEQGKLYDVEVAEFEKTAHPGQRGGYRLEYLNGYVPPVPEKKKSLAWLWILLGLIAVGAIIFLSMPRGEKVVEVEKIVEKEVIVRDTVYVQQIEAIEKDFNSAQFEKGQAQLNDDAKLALHDLAKVLKQNDALRLRIEGHTSAEGDAAVNQKLSEDRARAAVDFLVNKEGIDASRLEAVGKGSSEPIDPATPEANRRTQFVILD